MCNYSSLVFNSLDPDPVSWILDPDPDENLCGSETLLSVLFCLCASFFCWGEASPPPPPQSTPVQRMTVVPESPGRGLAHHLILVLQQRSRYPHQAALDHQVPDSSAGCQVSEALEAAHTILRVGGLQLLRYVGNNVRLLWLGAGQPIRLLIPSIQPWKRM